MTASLDKISKELQSLPKEVYGFWVNTTPKDTGQARRKTKLKKDIIHADYPYAKRLDEGWSQKAPKGMSEPTGKFIEQYLQRKMRK